MAIDREEFRAFAERVDRWLEGIHARLDVLNGRTRKSEERLTRLETWGSALVGMGGVVWAVVQFVVGQK